MRHLLFDRHLVLPILLGVLAVLAILTMLAVLFTWASAHEAKTISYVPPVREQLGNLPAEAILVRGSDLPGAAPGELLRAARGVEDKAAEELLRAGQAL